ncbi:MAG: DUF4189 domain-containing protein [Rhodospirillaceae bacterium]|nr:DUF4189 domain-containing protein [Rhodospirillaceae bacterium]
MTSIFRHLCVAAFAAAALAPLPAAAEGGEWGALALSERSTAYGFSYDYDSQETAAKRAMAECAKNAQDCRVHTTFRNTCLILAGSVDGPFGWAWGGREETRSERALAQCRQRGAVNCKVVRRVCSGLAGNPRAPRNPAPRTAPPPPGDAAPGTGAPPASRAPGAPLQLHRQ